MKLTTIANQPSWTIRNDEVELAVTQAGGQMAPVTFYRRGAKIQPYYISPWQKEKLAVDDPVLVPLRGDFFCAPFGAPGTHKGESHKCHGEPAWAKWTLGNFGHSGEATALTLSMKTRVRPGRVTKTLTIVGGQNVVYSRHVMEGYSGAMPLGHHAILAMPARQRSVLISKSPIRFGYTNPTPPGDPGEGSYYSAAVAKRFTGLSRVPMVWGESRFDDFTSFPAHKGFCDMLAVVDKAGALPAWTTATFEDEGYTWFSLKDASVLPVTMLWTENHGRHRAPWNGRNSCLGLEDICGFLAEGIAASVGQNALNRAGVPTAVKLSPKAPTVVSYIQGVVATGRGFGRVESVQFGPGKMTFVSSAGKKVTAEVSHEFLQGGNP
jgi:hypothetical protein